MTSGRLPPGQRRISALLGPTNTGKTHRAIERMLAWPTGMIGLPLRLLAREVYDRVVERRGPDAVALITGEEKRIGQNAAYWICTVEAMPTDRPVAFLAVDEIQLAGDRTRGHTFTDRLLHARGAEETLFLGAQTIAGLLQRLIGRVEIETAPRLSRLSWGGTHKLGSVPARSAVVAFSAEKVYETAERLRAVHGGAAVVLGALSPRTRNAQVAMYQAGEVEHLVATDAIGMGLNMDLTHVAFTDVRKFDGRSFRDLSAAEVAQIAGRAGRHRSDGTFGTVRDLGPLDPELIDAVEAHRFPPLRRLFWRNTDLDFGSAAALIDSLGRPPPFRFLVPALGEDDQRALEALLHREAVAQRITGPAELARLWDVCKIPDYRKTRTGAHAELLSHIALHLLDDGVLPDDFVAERIARLDRTDGDIETLMARIAWVRTWTFVAWQRGWTADPAHWQGRSRQVEDRLSDALHEQLTARFVDRRVSWVLRGSTVDAEVSISDDGKVAIGGIGVGTSRAWSFVPDAAMPRMVHQPVRHRLRTDVLETFRSLIESRDDAIEVDEEGSLRFAGIGVARLAAGPSVLEPAVVLARLDLLESSERERLRQRLSRWCRALVEGLFAPLDRPESASLSPPARGLVYALRQGLGTVDRGEVEANLEGLVDDDRRGLARLDVRLGTATVFVQSLLRPVPQRIRGLLWSVHRSVRPVATPPGNGRTTVPPDGYDDDLLRAVGFRVVGDLAVRVDVLEKVSAEARRRARQRRPADPDPLPSWLGTSPEVAFGVLAGLGFQVRRRDDGQITVRVRSR